MPDGLELRGDHGPQYAGGDAEALCAQVDRSDCMAERTRLEGAIDAASAVLHGGLATIEDVHAAIALKPFAALRVAPGVRGVSQAVRVLHDGISFGIYGGIRAGIGIVAVAAKAVAAATAIEDREPRAGSAADLAVAAINGVAGDRLERDGNPLAVKMSLRHGDATVAACREALTDAFPEASPRLALFIHGLAANDAAWRFYSREHYANDATTYGSRLRDDLGYTPLYVRYNSGLHISENGAQLAALLDRVVSAWPVAVEEILLIGHSMGGLVARSACHHAQRDALRWAARVRHVFFLGSPHRGAPLEKFGNVAAWVLDRFDVSRAFATVINKRSAAIKDLRFGAILDEHWQGADPDALLDDRTGAVRSIEGANHYFVAATLTRDPRHPLAVAIGDWLVREASAAPARHWRHLRVPFASGRHFGPMTHMQLLNHPEIYAQIRRWLES